MQQPGCRPGNRAAVQPPCGAGCEGRGSDSACPLLDGPSARRVSRRARSAAKLRGESPGRSHKNHRRSRTSNGRRKSPVVFCPETSESRVTVPPIEGSMTMPKATELTATVSKGGRIVIPGDVRKRLGLTRGSVLYFIVDDDGVRLLPAAGDVRRLKGRLPKPASPVSLGDMNQTMAERRQRAAYAAF